MVNKQHTKKNLYEDVLNRLYKYPNQSVEYFEKKYGSSFQSKEEINQLLMDFEKEGYIKVVEIDAFESEYSDTTIPILKSTLTLKGIEKYLELKKEERLEKFNWRMFILAVLTILAPIFIGIFNYATNKDCTPIIQSCNIFEILNKTSEIISFSFK